MESGKMETEELIEKKNKEILLKLERNYEVLSSDINNYENGITEFTYVTDNIIMTEENVLLLSQIKNDLKLGTFHVFFNARKSVTVIRFYTLFLC